MNGFAEQHLAVVIEFGGHGVQVVEPVGRQQGKQRRVRGRLQLNIDLDDVLLYPTGRAQLADWIGGPRWTAISRCGSRTVRRRESRLR